MDTVALVSVIVSGTVAVSVALASMFAAGREGKAARKHERRLARDARLFEHRANAYAGMMKLCEIHMDRVERRGAIFVSELALPSLPSDEEQTVVRGQFGTFASPEADEALESFLNQVLAFLIAADVFEMVRDQEESIGKAGLARQDARDETRARFKELKGRIREDLAAV